MSAYIESKGHIDALVSLAGWGPEGRPMDPGHAWSLYYGNPSKTAPRDGGPGASALGQMLVNENITSVQYRYRGEAVDTLPEPIDKTSLLDYQYAPGRPLTTVEGLVALDGYEYQSCEHPGWVSSEAYAFVNALRSRLIGYLPGYSEADTWSID